MPRGRRLPPPSRRREWRSRRIRAPRTPQARPPRCGVCFAPREPALSRARLGARLPPWKRNRFTLYRGQRAGLPVLADARAKARASAFARSEQPHSAFSRRPFEQAWQWSGMKRQPEWTGRRSRLESSEFQRNRDKQGLVCSGVSIASFRSAGFPDNLSSTDLGLESGPSGSEGDKLGMVGAVQFCGKPQRIDEAMTVVALDRAPPRARQGPGA